MWEQLFCLKDVGILLKPPFIELPMISGIVLESGEGWGGQYFEICHELPLVRRAQARDHGHGKLYLSKSNTVVRCGREHPWSQ